MRKLVFKPLARLDLLEIWNFIATDSIEAANKVKAKLDEAIVSLKAMPGTGHTRTDVKTLGLRFWTVYSFVIVYRYDDEKLTIVRVVHGHRNFSKLFRKSK